MSRARDAQLRREGMADAAVLLVARKFMPMVTLNDWANRLGLTHDEIVGAVDRLKQRAAPPVRTPKKTSSSTRRRRGPARQAMLDALQHGAVADEHGHASALLVARAGLDGWDAVAIATMLKDLEAAGLIRRDVRGKRTYRIERIDAAAGAA